MKVNTKFVLISLLLSCIPIVTVIWIGSDTPLFHQEDFQRVLTMGIATTVIVGFAGPLLTMHWLFLNQFRQIKNFCVDIRRGKHRPVHLPNEPREKNDENELTSLMREMNWMVNQISIREDQLKKW